MSILKWLGLPTGGSAARPEDTDTVRRIVDALERIEPAHARYIAAFAYLLGRVAYADQVVTAEETRLMERIVMERGDLPEDQAVLVVQIAKSQNVLFGGTEDFLVAREFAETATREQKLALLDCLYAVSAADASITVTEDNEIARIARELKLEHADLVRARLAHREYLRVLQRPES
jgi:uncharacterized tellurite resistance protein B-like protein